MAKKVFQNPIPLLPEAQGVFNNKWTYPSMKSFAPKKALIDYLFKTLYPSNTNLYEVHLKVSILNQFYSTKIFAVTKMANGIVLANIDADIQAGKISAVEKIAHILPRKNYSFASKYCAMHNPLAFPVNDRIVRGYLASVIAKGNLNGFSGGKTVNDFKMRTDYKYYKDVYDAFQSQYGLTSLKYQEIDAYIWITCKEPQLSGSDLLKLI